MGKQSVAVIMKHRLSPKIGKLTELTDLPKLDREELVEKWRILYGTEPPGGAKNNFLMHAIAYRIQEKALGGLKPATHRFLEKAKNVSLNQKTPVLSIKPGTIILREWHGTTHEVTVLENSVLYNGKLYRSLTKVAHVITGTRWSGPLFFDLKRKRNT